MKTQAPPIKSQGIKTKLVPWIREIAPEYTGKWVEPFMGTGVVAFNMKPQEALLCDSNPHVINFYQGVQRRHITSDLVRLYLEKAGERLRLEGDKWYYQVRENFNREHHPLDFLFLNRACFNGVIRFNSKGEFNTPYCKNDERFTEELINKMVSRVEAVEELVRESNYEFIHQDFRKTLLSTGPDDLVYLDPPYVGRNTTYHGGFGQEDHNQMYKLLELHKGKFMLSTWHHTQDKKNAFVDEINPNHTVVTYDHHYNVGGKADRRGAVKEAIVTNFEV